MAQQNAPDPEWFRSWAEHTGHTFFSISLEPELTIGYLSDCVAELTGYTAAELRDAPHILTQLLSGTEVAVFAAQLHGEDDVDLDVALAHRDGTMKSVHVAARKVRHDDGRVCVEGFAYDITDANSVHPSRAAVQSWLRLSFERSDVGLCVVDPEGRFLLVNPAFASLLSRSEAELTSLSWHDVTRPEDLSSDLLLIATALAERKDGFRVLKCFARPDGTSVWADVSASVVRHDDEPLVWVGQVVDQTARVTAEQALIESERTYRLLAENVTDVVVHTFDDVIQWVSPSVTRALGWQTAQLIGTHLPDYLHPDDIEPYWRLEELLAEQASVVVRMRARGADGTYHWLAANIAPFWLPDGTRFGTTASIRVVDADVEWETELDRRARYDDLTGLINRSELFDRMASLRAMSPPERMSVLFCDLDGFKTVNDTLGHAAGDDVLRMAAARVRSAIRPHDLVARMGGDEILVLLTGDPEPAAAIEVADRLRRAFEEPVATEWGPVEVTISIGVANATTDQPADDAIATADEAMYEAKQSGRNRVVHR